jgi:hypothetical protein
MQEGVADDPNLQELPASRWGARKTLAPDLIIVESLNDDRFNSANGAAGLALSRTEGRKIMLTNQNGSGIAHRGSIKATMGPADAAGQQRLARRRAEQQIAVRAPERPVAGMKARIDQCRVTDGDGRRKMRIDPPNPGRKGTLAVDVEMHDLSLGMNASVGSPSAHGLRTLAGDLGQRGLEAILRGLATWLSLPAFETRSIVGYDQRDTLEALGSLIAPSRLNL